jgi:hypothetical protein
METLETILDRLSAHDLGLLAQWPCRIGPAGVGAHALDSLEPVTAPGAPTVAWQAWAHRCIFHDEVIPHCTDVERRTCQAREGGGRAY